VTTATLSPSQDSYWDAENPDLGMPQIAEPEPDDATHFVNPPQNACPTCGEEVIKEPHMKRRPRYHPECKPQRGKGTSTGPRTVRVTSKEREAAEQVEIALDRARAGLMKAVALIALADPYDALVLHVNSNELIENLRPVLMRFPWLREQASNATAVGSIVGLVVTVFTTALPILAHHGFIPAKKLVPFFLQMPLIMLRMQERLAAAEQGQSDMGEELLARVAEDQRKKQEQAMRRASAETVNASDAH
jgi:hypothetical protein